LNKWLPRLRKVQKRSKRGIAAFARIQAKKPQYMISQKNLIDLYARIYKEITDNDKAIDTPREMAGSPIPGEEGSNPVGIPNIATTSLELGS
jgi:hypothetical protein